jgi:ferredoxin-NADP reductase
MGVSSGHLHRTIRAGDRLTVSAPAGRFTFTGGGDGNGNADAAAVADGVVLIGGGVGITPVMSMARYLTDRSWPGEIYFVVVAKTERDIIFRDELEQMRRRFPNLRLCVTLSRPAADCAPAGDTWAGERGRLSGEMLTRFVPDLTRRPVYLCGPDEMMNATRRLLIDLGVPDARIHTEAFASPGSQVMTGGLAEAAEAAGVAAESAGGGGRRAGAGRRGRRDAGGRPARPGGDGGVAVLDPGDPAGGDGGPTPSGGTVTFAKSGTTAALAPGQTVLEASEDVGVDIPYECRSGVCGQCKTKLLAGTVTMDVQDALSASEKSAGWILACQAQADEALTVEA